MRMLVHRFVSTHLCLAHHALKIARAYTRAISVQRMTCAVCLEDGATFACECTAYHATCLSYVLMRDEPWTHDYRICHSEYDRKLLASALEIAFPNSVDKDSAGSNNSSSLLSVVSTRPAYPFRLGAQAMAKHTNLMDGGGLLMFPRCTNTSRAVSSTQEADVDREGLSTTERALVYEQRVSGVRLAESIEGRMYCSILRGAASAPRRASKVLFHCNGVVYCGERRVTGGLDLPGGKAEGAETPRTCAVREVGEELRYADPETALWAEDSLARAPCARFLFDTEDCCFDVHVFLVQCEASTNFELTPEGKRELARPAWRCAEELLADLEVSRRPAAAGRAYATAVRALLSAVPCENR